MKHDWKFKLEYIHKYKIKHIIEYPAGINRSSFMHHIYEWTHIYDELGIENLKHKQFNKVWTSEEKLELVLEVIALKACH